MSARFFARRSGGGAAGARGGLGRFGGVGRCLERGVGRGGDVRLGGLGCLFGSLGDRFVGAGCARQRGLHQGNSAFGAGGRILGELLDGFGDLFLVLRSEEHTSELQSLMRISYAVFCLKKKNNTPYRTATHTTSV